MKKKKVKMIKQFSALGISAILIGGLIIMTLVESNRKTPNLAK